MVEYDLERICLDERRHGVVLAAPFARALLLATVGIGLTVVGWPATIAGVALQVVAAASAVRAVWNWESTRVVLTTEQLFVVHGVLRRRSASIPLSRVGPVEVEQTLLGRLLGYGTVVAGDLEIMYVPEPRRIDWLVERARAGATGVSL
jgi:uncharacterized membrane protein YdbT with pleckstrin-like domain